jgi:hypothetical protein
VKPRLQKQIPVRLAGNDYRDLRKGVLRRDGWRCQILRAIIPALRRRSSPLLFRYKDAGLRVNVILRGTIDTAATQVDPNTDFPSGFSDV